MHKHLIICADRAFSVENSRRELILCALKSYYKVTVVATGDLDESFLEKTKVDFFQLRSWKSALDLIKLFNFILLSKHSKVLVFNTKPLIIIGIISRILRRKGIYIGVFTGLGKMSNLNGNLNLIAALVLRFISKGYSRLIFQNKSDMFDILDNLPIKKNICKLIISSGVDTKRFYNKKNKNDNNINMPKNIVMIGRVAEKGFEDFCNISKDYKHDSNYNFIWYGEVDNHKQGQIETLSEESGVSYAGFVREIESVYSKADYLLFTSKYREGVPRVVLEAMSMMVPIVGYPIPGMIDVVQNNRNGLLAKNFTITELKKSLNILLNLKQDSINNMTINARRDAVELYDLEKISLEYFRVVNAVGV